MNVNLSLQHKLMRALVDPGNEKYADPWRLYQEVELFGEVIDYCYSSVQGLKLDIIAAVSELALPLSVSLAYEINKRTQFQGVVVLLIPNNTTGDWIYPNVSVVEKTVLLCDDLMASGGHMLKSLERLEKNEAKLVKALVILDSINYHNREDAEKVKQKLGSDFIALTNPNFR